jgi:hypothetical protein
MWLSGKKLTMMSNTDAATSCEPLRQLTRVMHQMTGA